MNNFKKTFLILLLFTTLFACGRPEKPVAKIAGKWISHEQWEAFLKSRSMTGETDPEKLRNGLEQLVRREIAVERGKRKGLFTGDDWKLQNERIERSVMVKMYITDHYLGGNSEPDESDIQSITREEKSQRRIFGVPVKDSAEAAKVADQLRKGADIGQLFQKHRGDFKNAPPAFDFGLAGIKQLPPEIQQHFFTAAPGTVLDPVRYGNEGYIVPVLHELVTPDLSKKPDPGIIKKAEMVKLQKAIKKANDELKARFPEAFDEALVSSLLAKERPTEEDMNMGVGTVGKEKIPFSALLEAYYGETQRSGGQLQKSVVVFRNIFSMLCSERRIAAAAREEGYHKMGKVRAQVWDFSQEAASQLFMQDYIKNYVVSEAVLKEYFDSKRDSFSATARYNLRYLLSADPNAIQSAILKVKQGAPWNDALHSPGILPETGSGELGWKSEEELSQVLGPRLISNLAKARKGTWAADPIGPGKYGAFQVLDKEEPQAMDFDTAREKVTQKYLMEKSSFLIQEYLDKDGREGISVETFTQNLT